MGFPSVSGLLPRAVLPPIWRELAALEALWSGRAAVPAPASTGRGEPVLLIPGFLVGDATLHPLTSFLREAGHYPHSVGIGHNVDCSERSVARVTAVAEELAQRYARPITLLGHSRGGLFARVLARRRPELVSSVITLGSPHRDQLAVHPLVWASAATLATFGTVCRTGVLGWSCGASRCCAAFSQDVREPLPTGIGLLSIYSRQDGIVDWRACLDPAARQLEVASTHCGMVAHAPTLWAVAEAIADFSPPDTLAPTAHGPSAAIRPCIPRVLPRPTTGSSQDKAETGNRTRYVGAERRGGRLPEGRYVSEWVPT